LQVAVDDEGEVVEFLAGGDTDRTERFDLVHLAVAEERPHVLVGRVLDTAVVQIAVEPGLVDGVDRAEAHRDGRELPEVRHQPRVGIGRQAAAGAGQFLPEPVELVFGQPALEEGPCVDARGGMPLEIDLVGAALGAAAAEEVVETDLVQ